MIKKAQSLLDFINFMPPQAVDIERSLLTVKEADGLYKLFKNSERDEYGNIKLPDDIDSTLLMALTTKGVIESDAKRVKLFNPQRSIKITSKGKDVIKKLILSNEKSTFVSNTKTASVDIWHYDY